MSSFRKFSRLLVSFILVAGLAFPAPALAATQGDLQSAYVPSLHQDGQPVDEPSAILVQASADVFGFIYVNQKEIALGEVQDIALGLADETQSADSARITLEQIVTGEQVELDSTQIEQYALAFSFNTDTLSQGTWKLVKATYASGETTTEVDLRDAGDATFEVVADAAEQASTTFYTVEDDQVVQADSLQDAVGKAQTAVSEPTVYSATGVATFAAGGLARTAAPAVSNIVVGLDPGHGGTDGGASGNGAKESDLNWKIASYCRDELLHYNGIEKVVFSRSQNEYTNDGAGGLQLRVQRLKDAGADVIVSIHLNASGTGEGSGAEVYAPNTSGNSTIHTQGTQLAAKIAAELKKLGITLRSDNGVKYRDDTYGTGTDYYSIIYNSKAAGIPGIIVEHCFIDNASDYNNYLNTEEKLKKLGVADATGIASYFGLSKWSWTPKITIGKPNNGKVKIVVDNAGAPKGLKEVQIPVWCDTKGQNDIVWYTTKKASNGKYYCYVDLPKHNEMGTYYVHVYAKVNKSDFIYVNESSFLWEKPTTTLYAPVVNEKKGTLTYTAHIKSPNGTPTINLKVWCSAKGKDDLVSYSMKRISGTEDEGDYKVTVKMSKHDWQVGVYNAYLYVTDPQKMKASTKKQATKMSLPAIEFTTKLVNNGKSYRITGSGGLLASATSARFAVWSKEGGKDDLRWYTAKKSSGVWKVSVPLSKHGSSGTYYAKCYAVVKKKDRAIGYTTFKVDGPSVTFEQPKVYPTKGKVTFTAKVTSTIGINKVQLPVWCKTVKGQDDLRWYTMKRKSGNAKSGTYAVTVSMSKHKYQSGNYVANAYATDKAGVITTASTKQKMSLPTSTIKATKQEKGKYYKLTASDGFISKASSVSFAVWSEVGGQNDLRWYKAKKTSAGKWYFKVPIANHKSSGTFQAHCYATLKGTQSLVGSTTFDVEGSKVTARDPLINNAAGSITYTVDIDAPLGIKSVKLPVYCESIGGTDDKKTYTMTRVSGNSTKATYTCTVYIKDHKYQTGNYVAKPTVTDKLGIVAQPINVKNYLELPYAAITATPTSNGTKVLLSATGGYLSKATKVQFPVWSEIGGQDDIVWYNAKKVGNAWQATVNLSKHQSSGDYIVHCYATIKGNLGFSGQWSFYVDPSAIAQLGYPIMGNSAVSQARMVANYNAWITANKKSYPASAYKDKGAPTIEAFISELCKAAEAEGVRAEVVYAQAMHETGYLQFGNDVKANQCNFCGLGATGGVPGHSFNSVYEGFLAQAQHLKAYACTDALKQSCVDPRFTYVTRGCAPTVEALGGHWAPSTTYGEKVVAIIRAL